MKKILQILLCILVINTQNLMALSVDEITVNTKQQIVALYYDDNTIVLYSLKNGNILHRLDIPKESTIEKIFFSSDGKKFILYIDEGKWVWNVDEDWEQPRKFLANEPDDKQQPQTIQDAFNTIRKHIYVKRYIYNKKENTFVVIYNNNLSLWDKDGHNEIAKVQLKDFDIKEIKDIQISDDSDYIALSVSLKERGSEVILLDASNFKVLDIIKPQSGEVSETTFINNKELLLNSYYPIEVWDVKAKEHLYSFTKNSSKVGRTYIDIFQEDLKPYHIDARINGLAVNKEGDVAIAGNSMFLASVLMENDGKLIQIYKGAYASGTDTHFSEDGKKVVFSYFNEKIMIFETYSAKLLGQFSLGGVPNSIKVVKFSPNGNYIATGSDGSTLSIVDLKDNIIKKQIKMDAGIYSLGWVDEKHILVGTEASLILVDIETSKRRVILQRAVYAIDVAKDNSMIAIGNNEEESSIILNKDYKVIHTLNDKNSLVGRIAFSRELEYLVTSSSEVIQLWNLEIFQSQLAYKSETSIWGMAYDSIHHRIYLGGDDGIVYQVNEKNK